MRSRHYKLFFLFAFLTLFASSYAQYFPQKDLGQLFVDVQLAPVFPDSKTFVDCKPKHPVQAILAKYNREKTQRNFDLPKFVAENFIIPESPRYMTSDTFPPIEKHINNLWQRLIRQDEPSTGSLITLPEPYVVPGGRFNEMYYWDSYFTMLGLQVSHREDLIRNMVNNFSYLITTFGLIPNGTRTYYLSRSQPPFFSLMVELLAETDGSQTWIKYLPSLQAEYDFWMKGAEHLVKDGQATGHVVRLDEHTLLNRYWDNDSTPRPESYKEDVATASGIKAKPEYTYRNLRAACESGWDFSARWFRDGLQLSTIHTTELIPVDLNSLLYHLEKALGNAYAIKGEHDKSELYNHKAQARKDGILKYCWDETKGFFMDYDYISKKTITVYSLAGVYPLFLEVATQQQADQVADRVNKYFLFSGGLVSTVNITHQQWDAPNGWAPLQWITYRGLMKYNHKKTADDIRTRWLTTVWNEYNRSGKMLEKYNVLYPDLPGGGGEYPSQDGFGWTNGVYLKMKAMPK